MPGHLHELVESLRRAPRSRNRHFDELSQPLAVRACKVLRRLEALTRELDRAPGVEVRPEACSVVLRWLHPELKLRRIAYLSWEEYRWLVSEPRLRGRLETEPAATAP